MIFKKINHALYQMNPRAATGYHPTLVIQQNRVPYDYGSPVVCAEVTKLNINLNKLEGTAKSTTLLKVFRTPNPPTKIQMKKKAVPMIPFQTAVPSSNPK